MKYLMFLLPLLIFSCEKNWQQKIKTRLVTANDIDINKIVINKGTIKNPPRTWLKLITFKRDNKKECLMYKVPHKNVDGILQLSKSCELEKSKDILVEGVKSLSLDFSTNVKSRKRGVLILELMKDSIVKIEIPLINYKFHTDYKKFSSHLKDGHMKSIIIGKEKRSKSYADGRMCHGVNIECRDIIPNKCDQCESGFYEVVDFNCPQGGSKFCGIEKCGKKGQPACPRGYKVLDTKLKSLCFEGSPAGFCEPGLRTFCNEDKVLVCI